MKETGTAHWLSPNEGATNSSGFTGLPGGYRYLDGRFINKGNSGGWWVATEDNTTNARNRYLDYYGGTLDKGSNYKTDGFSVRCIKD